MNRPQRPSDFDWAQGAVPFYRDRPYLGRVLYVSVPAHIAHLGAELALIDTAAGWSVIGGWSAEQLGCELGDAVGEGRLQTWHGTYDGSLHRLNVTLPDLSGWGADLTIDATCLVLPDWPFANVLAYRGCLERIRIALDPGSQPDTETLYFGLIV